jgi:hypothetical protein
MSQAKTLQELQAAFEKGELKLDHKNTKLVGIHDGSSDGIKNYAAIINRTMFYTFILACTAYLVRELWPNEKKGATYEKVLVELGKMGVGETAEEKK